MVAASEGLTVFAHLETIRDQFAACLIELGYDPRDRPLDPAGLPQPIPGKAAPSDLQQQLLDRYDEAVALIAEVYSELSSSAVKAIARRERGQPDFINMSPEELSAWSAGNPGGMRAARKI